MKTLSIITTIKTTIITTLSQNDIINDTQKRPTKYMENEQNKKNLQ